LCFSSFVFFNSFTSQKENNISVAVACLLIGRILHIPTLKLFIDYPPSTCVAHSARRDEELPVPPDDVVAQGWTVVIKFLRVRPAICRERAARCALIAPIHIRMLLPSRLL
jgi:hypothetical protein